MNPKVVIGAGASHIYDMNYLYGFISAFVVYFALSYFFPAGDTLVSENIYEDEAIEGMEFKKDDIQTLPQDLDGERKAAYVVVHDNA